MSTTTTRKKGDTAPSLLITCYDGDAPVDLSAATVRLIIRLDDGTVSTVNTTGTAGGVVDETLPGTVTATTGVVHVEVEVTWPDATVQTFPATGYLTVNVVADLG